MKKVSASAQPVPDIALPGWQPPECPFAIEYSADVLEQIRVAAMDAFFSLPHGGAEIGGVLFGIRHEAGVRVLACRALPCEYAFGPSFTLSARDHERFQLLLLSRDLQEEGYVPVGWYHSHTRTDVKLSPRDLELHGRYFPDALDIALVVRPHAFEPMRAGFFFRGPDGAIHSEASYLEFRVGPASPVPPAHAVAVLQEPAPRPATAAARVLPARPHLPARRWPWLAGLAALLLVLVLAFFFVRHGSRAAAALPVSLLAYDLGGQLQIRWDGAAERVRHAGFGSLEITDGPEKTHIDMDPARLRSGSLSYARQTARVDIRLVLIQPDARATEELTTFLGRTPSSPAWNAVAENVTLRQELEKQAAHSRELEHALDDMETNLLRQRLSHNADRKAKRR